MLLLFYAYVHQDKIKILECKDPSAVYKIKKNPPSKSGLEEKSKIISKEEEILPFSDDYRSTLLDYIKTGSLIPTYLFLYLTQKTTINQIFSTNNDFKNELNHTVIDALTNIPQSEEDFITSTEQDDRLIRALIKTKYCLQYKEEKDAVLDLDFCFEYLVDNKIKSDINNTDDVNVKRFYVELKDKGNIEQVTDYDVKDYVEKVLCNLINSGEEISFDKLTRKTGIYYIAIYYYLKKVAIDTAKNKIEILYSIWKNCSDLKHNSDGGYVTDLTDETLSWLIDFFTPEQREKYNKWFDHFSFIKDIIERKYKFYLNANMN